MSDRYSRAGPRGFPREIACPETSLYYNLEVSATRHPHKPFLIFYDSALAYGEFRRHVDALAGYLQRRCGVRKGDRVLLYLQNCPQFMIAFYAVLRADAVVVPVSPMNLGEELRHFGADSGARVAVVGQELAERIAPLAGELFDHLIVVAYSDYLRRTTDLRLPDSLSAPRAPTAIRSAVSWGVAIDSGDAPGAHTAGPEDLCVLAYSSGTTGRPKGCMHSHRTAMSTAVCTWLWAGLICDTVSLCSLPLFHVTAMQSGMNGPIFLGQTVALMQRWDRETAVRLIERYRIASWTTITTMVIDFLANPDLPGHDLSSLAHIGGGGAAMPEAIAREIFELSGLEYLEGYGLTETMAPTHINPRYAPKRQCLGVPISGTDARIVDLDSGSELGPGAVGEIVVSGPQVFLGYWNNPKATSEAFIEIDGKRFLRTGDLGRRDEDGYFFIVDRLKRMINASGMKVWPAEIESLMHAHPDIQEACVIGARDAYRGETVKAVVVLKPDQDGRLSAEEIVAWCRARMAAYKVPRIIEFAQTLPKSATGKVQWRLLQERESGQDSQGT